MTDRLRAFLQDNFSEKLIREDNFRDQVSFYLRPEAIVEICQALYNDANLQVKYLADITSLDWYGHSEEENGRFEVVYNMYSLPHQYRFFLKVRLPEDAPSIESLTTIFDGANWMEREVFDMMGIRFEGHPDLTRILTPDDFEGHPLRRDFPLTYEEPQFSWNKDAPPKVIK